MPTNLQELSRLIEAKVEGPDARHVNAFCRQLFEKAPREFWEEFSAEDLLAMSERALDFMQMRAPQQVLVRVYNPSARTHGWQNHYSVLEIALGDRPFIVDSVQAGLWRQGVKLKHFLHPILRIKRGSEGNLILSSLGQAEGSTAEAYELFLIERLEDPQRRTLLESHIRSVLTDVVLATEGYAAMRKMAGEVRDHLIDLGKRLGQLTTRDGPADLEEYVDFMDWLMDDNFIFLGYRAYQLLDHQGVRSMQTLSESALGILSKLETSTYFRPVPLTEVSDEVRRRITGGPILLVTKSNAESTVHRPVRMDYIGVKRFDGTGRACGERRFLGLFTSKAHSTPVQVIPILRRRLRQVLTLDDAIEGSHDFKQMVAIFNSMPREELFWSAAEQLHRDIRTIMNIEKERGVRVTVRPDPLSRGLALMVIMPRDRFNTEVRRLIQELLTEKLQATHVDYRLAIGEDEAQVRFHFFFTTTLSYDSVDLAAIDREVSALTRTWDDQLLEVLTASRGAEVAAELASRYGPALDPGYKAAIPPTEAARDIDGLEALGGRSYRVSLENLAPGRYPQQASHLKIYHQQPTLVLSEIFPVLENLGLRVIEQISYPVRGVRARDEEQVFDKGIDIFRIQDEAGQPLEIAAVERRLAEAVVELLQERVENDRLNYLVLRAGLNIHQVGLLRAYRGYLAQLQAATSRSFITKTLCSYPDSTRNLYRYFEARFGPLTGPEGRQKSLQETEQSFLHSLDAVSSLPEDLTLRSLFQLMKATLRSNLYQNKPCISLKIDSGAVEGMPEPRPLYEIFVTSPTVEGIHLRGGKVARGGLRWSDRPDDFRTEILGLMKTQMTKNAVIVPVGSKGGFVVKRGPSDREKLPDYVRDQYQTFVRGLLDLTDNIVDGKVVHPSGLVVYDPPDPYLVVAADKGTATFSDIANGISQEYGFWLGDAFASGGSYGYDHKKEGITARGTWECVARHFREMGVDVRNQEFTVVGIGDMSGDVFGNGMLFSDKIQLLAAFNHLHIFIDPDPDPIPSLQERQRLFQLPRSGWDDYDRSLISTGGGVFSRHSKSIPLSQEIRTRLGIAAEAISGQDLVRALLQMPVDLLWNGGIGTYVKAGKERNSEVGDSANDAVRIDADQLRAKVVGEGGNLGLTQLARIEYSLAGGRINTDAIDNSAGVDMSDHEVNIKILLQPLIREGRLSWEERIEILKAMTDEVARLVLSDNYGQSLCLSMDQRSSRDDLRLYESLLEYLAERGNLKASVEFLPDRKVREARRREGVGLTRPELAILLGYTKMELQRLLLETALVDESQLQHYLIDYFPRRLREAYSEAMGNHPLRREIVACQLTNRLVDRLGMAFVHGVSRDCGADPREALRAILSALEVLHFQPLWTKIFSLDNQIAAETQLLALKEITGAVEGVAKRILLGNIDTSRLTPFIETYREPLQRLALRLRDLLPSAERNRFQKSSRDWLEAGFPPETAEEIACLEYLPSGMGVIDVSREVGASLDQAAQSFYAIGDRLALGWLRDSVADLPCSNTWEKIAAGGLIIDLSRVQQRLTTVFLTKQPQPGLSFSDFFSRFPDTMRRFDRSLQDIRAEQKITLAGAAVTTRLLLQLSDQASSDFTNE